MIKSLFTGTLFLILFFCTPLIAQELSLDSRVIAEAVNAPTLLSGGIFLYVYMILKTEIKELKREFDNLKNKIS